MISMPAVRAIAVVMGLAMTGGLMLLLPFLEAITSGRDDDLVVQAVNTAALPPPPPPMEEEKPEEEEEEPPPEPEPPKLAEDSAPLDLSQLELALNPGTGGGVGADVEVKLPVASTSGDGKDGASDFDALFSLADLDEKPRAMFQPGPTYTTEMQRAAPATVYIIFTVDQRGRVENPLVQGTSNPIFDTAALNAIKQWKFEPGKRNGQPVRFRMRVPITFPKTKK
jgi:protein TonB